VGAILADGVEKRRISAPKRAPGTLDHGPGGQGAGPGPVLPVPVLPVPIARVPGPGPRAPVARPG